jgi:hypothetical protein
VVVLIDETAGARLATAEKQRLDRLRNQGRSVGSITIANTLAVLARAAGTEHLPDRGSMQALYSRLRKLDDGLVPIADTALLSATTWSRYRGGSAPRVEPVATDLQRRRAPVPTTGHCGA